MLHQLELSTETDEQLKISLEFEGYFTFFLNYFLLFVVQQVASGRENKQRKTISYRDSAAIAFLLDFLRRTPSLRVICFNYKISSSYLPVLYTGSDVICFIPTVVAHTSEILHHVNHALDCTRKSLLW